jgi:hypothetical protein
MRQARPRPCPSIAATLCAAVAAALGTNALAADLILNEWNCVGSTKWLNNPDAATATCANPEGPDGFGCADDEDSFFGRVLGNGGDWIELVVTTDHADIRGWKIQWIELGSSDSDGTNIWWGNGNVPQGEITFSQSPLWSDLRAGTIITITERPTADGGLDTDISFSPCGGDWWINVNCFDSALVNCNANVFDPTTPDYDDPLDVGNDNWRARIVDETGTIVIGLVGENAPGWAGTGINSKEVGKLEEDPNPTITPSSNYQDANNSTFGQPNSWNNDFTGCRTYQDFEPLRAAVRDEVCASCIPLVLNEYNAVSGSGFLNGGTAGADEDGGAASDSFFGRVEGNGGNWIELVVQQDGADIRGWTIEWQEVSDGTSGSIRLANNDALAGLEAGTIITIIEDSSAEGGLDTDLTYDAASGYLWINLNSFDTSVVASTTGSDPKHVSGEFSTSNDDWRMRVRNAAGDVVADWAGEGSIYFNHGRVSGTDVCRLRQDVDGTVTPCAAYDDTSSDSTFGAPNVWTPCPVVDCDGDGIPDPPGTCPPPEPLTQELGGCSAPARPGDANGDGRVDGLDLAAVLSAWGSSQADADLNGDGTVNAFDLSVVLGGWTG